MADIPQGSIAKNPQDNKAKNLQGTNARGRYNSKWSDIYQGILLDQTWKMGKEIRIFIQNI